MRLTVQLTSSPTRPEYSEKMVSRSASRTFCRITCLAVWAEMRPRDFGGLGETNFRFQLSSRIHPLRVVERDLLHRILDRFHYFLNAIDFERTGGIVEGRDQIFGGAKVLAGRHQHGVLHRIDHDLRVDALLLAQNLNGLIDTSHCFLFSNCLGVNYQSNFRLAFWT